MKSSLSLLIAFLLSLSTSAQTAYKPVKGFWERPGAAAAPEFTETRNILQYGADPQGLQSSDQALEAAVAALQGRPGVIYIPAGTYRFNAAFDPARDSITIRGAGHDSTLLHFDLGGRLQNAISIRGAAGDDTSLLRSPFLRGDSVISVENAAAFSAGDWLVLSIDDAGYMSSPWALGSLGQTVRIRSISGKRLVLDSRARFDYHLRLRPRVRRILPRQQVRIECLGIERMDATPGQTSGIVFDRAVNCGLSGIAMHKANFAHVELNRSASISIRNSYFTEAFAYGGGGQGYGVLLQNGSNECLVSGNYFRHLRHSMVLQSGANGNVLSYNYSTEPFWTEPSLPDSSAGEIVLHGDYPFMNLAEGNIVRNIVIDDSHGTNGPLNTFFRNSARGFGIFMNFSQPTDSQQFIGNEITNARTGLYFLSGRGHFQYANNYLGSVNNAGSIPDPSLYLAAGTRPECSEGLVWPAIGESSRYNAGTIPVVERVNAGEEASCTCRPVPVPASVGGAAPIGSWTLVPNPASDRIRIAGCAETVRVSVFDATGRLLRNAMLPAGEQLPLSGLSGGLYLLRIEARSGQTTKRLIVRP